MTTTPRRPAVKTVGQLAYEEDVRRHPTYDDGGARKPWEELSQAVQANWDRYPTARVWKGK